MDPRRFRRLKDLVAAALEHPAATRAAFLREHGADDPALLDEALALLAVAGETFEERFTAAVAARVGREAARASETPRAHPETVGPYRITGVLGQGGMGTVYRAEQREPLRREVALKVMRRGLVDSAAAARFAAEIQVLATMDHPHIARVHDAGRTEDGRAFFAMELVDGRPLTRYCDEGRLPLEQRLELFRLVCHAVQHAHQRGVIHRDLKPSNVLVSEVDGVAVPRVIDFGIAKLSGEQAADAPLLTEAGMLLGTLEYMSPEQAARGATTVDTRADIYSLGVLLYELVSGCLPFDAEDPRGTDVLEIQRRLLEEDPPRPSRRFASGPPATATAVARARATDARTLRRRLRGDLDWVVMKALEKDPDRRYQSAFGLAQEIGRVLRHEPVTAGPPSARNRAAKFVRRHRVGVLAAAAIFVALIAGTTVAVHGLVRATRSQQRAEAEVATTRAINDFLTDMLVAVQPDRARGQEVSVRDILEAAAQRLDDEETFAGSPEVEASLSYTIGTTYSRLGDYHLALQFLEHALAIRRRLLQETDERLIATLDEIGRVHWLTGDLDVSLQVAQEILAIRERTTGRHTADYAAALGNVGNTYADMGRLDEAERYLREALAVDREIMDEDDAGGLAVSLNNLGTLLADRKNFAEAIELHRESLALRRRVHGEPSPAVQTALNNLGFAQMGLGDAEAAETTLREALRNAELLYGPEHPQTALARINLAGPLRSLGRHEEAEELLRAAIPVFESSLGPRAWRTGSAHSSLGATLTDLGRYDEAEDELLLGWEILGETLDAGSWQVRGAARSLSELYARWGKESLAATWDEQAARDPD